MNITELCNELNAISCPWVAKTEEEHAQDFARRRELRFQIERRFRYGIDYRELSNGMARGVLSTYSLRRGAWLYIGEEFTDRVSVQRVARA